MSNPRNSYVDSWRREFGRDAEYAVVVDVLRASRLVTRGIEQVLQDHDLNMAQWTILSVVYFSPDRQLPLGKIAEIIAVHPSTVSNAVDKLEASGWMARKPLDRRTVFAALSPDGTQRLRKVQETLVASHFGLAPLRSAKEAAQILDALSAVQSPKKKAS